MQLPRQKISEEQLPLPKRGQTLGGCFLLLLFIAFCWLVCVVYLKQIFSLCVLVTRFFNVNTSVFSAPGELHSLRPSEAPCTQLSGLANSRSVAHGHRDDGKEGLKLEQFNFCSLAQVIQTGTSFLAVSRGQKKSVFAVIQSGSFYPTVLTRIAELSPSSCPCSA